MESLNEVGGRLCGSHQSGSKLLPMQIKMFRRMLAYNYFKRPHTIKFEKKTWMSSGADFVHQLQERLQVANMSSPIEIIWGT
jgi:hypothetical protein